MCKILIYIVSFFSFLGWAQDAKRLQHEIDEINTRYEAQVGQEDLIVIVGSSSVRMWHSVDSEYPDVTILNTGFGGSHMSDLLVYYKDLIVKYNPKKVLIYEGDNDIIHNKSAKKVLRQAKRLTRKLRRKLPNAQLAFISAKPSITRWNKKDEYESYNQQLKVFALKKGYDFIDVWSAMLVNDEPKKELFLEDGVHMNEEGYNVWRAVIGPSFKL